MAACRLPWFFSLLLLCGCLPSLQMPGNDPAAIAEYDCVGDWFGPLLRREADRPDIQKPDTALPGLRQQAKAWRRHWRKVGDDLQGTADFRRTFYAGIETFIPTEMLQNSRYEVQKALAEATSPETKIWLETAALTTEHAILTQRAVRMGNGVATGEIKASGLLTAAESLSVFRHHFGYLLPQDYWGPTHRELAALDATGVGLLKALDNRKVVLEFYAPPKVRQTDMQGRTGSIDERLAECPWEAGDRKAYPGPPDSENLSWWTQLLLEAKVPANLSADVPLELIVWGPSQPFKLQVNEQPARAVTGAPGTAVVRIPLPADRFKPGTMLRLTATVQGRGTALPFRTALVLQPGN